MKVNQSVQYCWKHCLVIFHHIIQPCWQVPSSLLICHHSWTVLLSRKIFATERSVSQNASPDAMVRTSVKGSRCFWMHLASLLNRCSRPCSTARAGYPSLVQMCGKSGGLATELEAIEICSLKPNDTSTMASIENHEPGEENKHCFSPWTVKTWCSLKCFFSFGDILACSLNWCMSGDHDPDNIQTFMNYRKPGVPRLEIRSIVMSLRISGALLMSLRTSGALLMSLRTSRTLLMSLRTSRTLLVSLRTSRTLLMSLRTSQTFVMSLKTPVEP